MESLIAANTRFSLDLFMKISNGNRDNVIFSPFSLSSALAMVYLGAQGDTASQMAQTLHFHEVKEDVHIEFSQLLSMLNKPEASYSLSIANRLFGEQSYQFIEKFLTDSRRHYDAELEPVNFRSGAEAARVNINTWVEKQTNGVSVATTRNALIPASEKIKNLLTPGMLDPLTRLVLVNAIYFKGNWQRTFDPAKTREMRFKINKFLLWKKTVPVMMMCQKDYFGLTNIPEAKFQVLEMPYDDEELSMLIMLPNDVNGLEELEQKLTYENFMDWTRPDRMRFREVILKLPKFKLEETYDMEQVLSSMGMVDAFDEQKCDFSSMSPDNDLVLSKVVQKAFVEVNEESTEAAAATECLFIRTSSLIMFKPLPVTFTADHPFLFFIRHNPTKSIIFYGRFCSPGCF